MLASACASVLASACAFAVSSAAVVFQLGAYPSADSCSVAGAGEHIADEGDVVRSAADDSDAAELARFGVAAPHMLCDVDPSIHVPRKNFDAHAFQGAARAVDEHRAFLLWKIDATVWIRGLGLGGPRPHS